MKRNYKILVIALAVLMIAVPVAYAEDIIGAFAEPTVKVVYEGGTPIKDSIDAKIAVENAKWFWETKNPVDNITEYGRAAEVVMVPLHYPYVVEQKTKAEPIKDGEPTKEDPKQPASEVTIIKTRFDESTRTMWYWISATRDGQEVAVDNPVWVYPAPKDVVVSKVKDEGKNEITVTLKEDPKGAVEKVLQDYADRQPIGLAVTGTKE